MDMNIVDGLKHTVDRQFYLAAFGTSLGVISGLYENGKIVYDEIKKLHKECKQKARERAYSSIPVSERKSFDELDKNFFNNEMKEEIDELTSTTDDKKRNGLSHEEKGLSSMVAAATLGTGIAYKCNNPIYNKFAVEFAVDTGVTSFSYLAAKKATQFFSLPLFIVSIMPVTEVFIAYLECKKEVKNFRERYQKNKIRQEIDKLTSN